MASLSQAGRLTGLGKITITRAIKSSWHSATGKLDGEATEPETLARQSRSLIPWRSARAQVVTQAELQQRVALAEEKLADLKTALDDMRAQRDAWQAMVRAGPHTGACVGEVALVMASLDLMNIVVTNGNRMGPMP